jgi:fatty-acid peroxygenase
MKNKAIPSEKVLDSTFSLLHEGYDFIRKRCEKHHSEIFRTRLMGKPVICVSGREAAALFYDPRYFLMEGAMPLRGQNTLSGRKGAQTLDGQEHRQRKEMFMSLMGPEQLQKLAIITKDQWESEISTWEQMDRVVLLEAARDLMCRVACRWAGVQVSNEEILKRSREFWWMIDAFGGIGLRHQKSRIARNSSEKWLMNHISKIRNSTLSSIPGSAAHTISLYQENGKLLGLKTAAVELITILRPIVAISYSITFAALALYSYPQYRKRIQEDGGEYAGWFIREVRRFYPFAPFIGARVRTSFAWKGYKFPQGRLVLFDVYGTCRDRAHWADPEEFRPERFRNWQDGGFDLFAQEGGDHFTGQHCAGEWVTIEALKVAVQLLANMEYDIPEQDLDFNLSRMLTFPKSHVIIRNVKVPRRVSELV